MNPESVRDYMTGLQNRIVAELERVDGGRFRRDRWERLAPRHGAHCVACSR